MKIHKTLASLIVAAPVVGQMQAALVFGGDFQMYKPGTGYAVTAEFAEGTAFARGVGDGIELANGTVNYSDGTTGTTIDLPGWAPLQSGNDLAPNGFGGSTGMNLFAAWGGDGRIVSASSVGTIAAVDGYTITAMVGGPDTGPIQGPLAFHLLADGVQLTPSSIVDPSLPNGGAFQMISRTYDAAAIAGHLGAEMTIVVGVEDANDFGNRVIFDDISLVVVPEPAAPLLLGVGALALSLLRSRRK